VEAFAVAVALADPEGVARRVEAPEAVAEACDNPPGTEREGARLFAATEAAAWPAGALTLGTVVTEALFATAEAEVAPPETLRAVEGCPAVAETPACPAGPVPLLSVDVVAP
jgi:hypothetical protein